MLNSVVMLNVRYNIHMKVCLEIDFKNKNVLILGGGHVALRKTHQFLNAKAHIYLYSLEYLDEFNNLDVTILDFEDFILKLDEATLLIVASSDKDMNQKMINLAKSKHILVMSSMKDLDSDTYSVIERRIDDLLIATNTSGAFPLFSNELLSVITKRLSLLKTLRERINDKKLSSLLIKLKNEELSFLIDSINNEGILYIMHGSKDNLAHIEATKLIDEAHNTFKRPVSYLFIGKRFRHIEPSEYLSLIESLNINLKVLLIFNDMNSSYVKDMLKLFPLSQVIIPDFNLISDEYITHINGHNKGDVITITYSSYMQSKYPSQRYISALSLPSIIEDIIHKSNV